MSIPSQLRVGSSLTTWRGIPHQETAAADKENYPFASLSGGDVVKPGSVLMPSEIQDLEIPGPKPKALTAQQRQVLMLPEIPGLEMPPHKAVKDRFYGNWNHDLYITLSAYYFY